MNIIDDFNRVELTINAYYSESGRTVATNTGAAGPSKYTLTMGLNSHPATSSIIAKHKVFISSISSQENLLRTHISSALIEAIAKMYWTVKCLIDYVISGNFIQNGKMNTTNFIPINL